MKTGNYVVLHILKFDILKFWIKRATTFKNYAMFLSVKFKLACCRHFSPICSSSFYPPHHFGLMQGTEQAIICPELIFWFPHSATVADQHLMGRAELEP